MKHMTTFSFLSQYIYLLPMFPLIFWVCCFLLLFGGVIVFVAPLIGAVEDALQVLSVFCHNDIINVHVHLHWFEFSFHSDKCAGPVTRPNILPSLLRFSTSKALAKLMNTMKIATFSLLVRLTLVLVFHILCNDLPCSNPNCTFGCRLSVIFVSPPDKTCENFEWIAFQRIPQFAFIPRGFPFLFAEIFTVPLLL
jgi:hypothetical protein